MLAGAVLAYARSMHRVALTAALSTFVSALFVAAYLDWLPISDRAVHFRVLALTAPLVAVVLWLMLLAMLGLLRDARMARRARWGAAGLSAAVVLVGWLVGPLASLALSSVLAIVIGVAAVSICVRSALRGDRLAWVMVVGVVFMLVAFAAVSGIALSDDPVPWPRHAVGA